MDTSSKLAAATRAARARYDALDRCGHPVRTEDRESARAAVDAARDAERAYWAAVSP